MAAESVNLGVTDTVRDDDGSAPVDNTDFVANQVSLELGDPAPQFGDNEVVVSRGKRFKLYSFMKEPDFKKVLKDYYMMSHQKIQETLAATPRIGTVTRSGQRLEMYQVKVMGNVQLRKRPRGDQPDNITTLYEEIETTATPFDEPSPNGVTSESSS